VQALGLKNIEEWQKYCKSGDKPQDIPANASQRFKNEWKSWGDWLGTGTIQSQKRQYTSFPNAREFVHKLGLKNIEEWQKYCKSGNKPQDIPADPAGVYNTDWTYWGDWLGTGFIALSNRVYRSFDESKCFVHKLGLKNQDQWFEYCKTGNRPADIPVNPRDVYKNDWIDMPDWLGYEDPDWSIRRVKELLKDLIKSKIIYQWNEAVLFSFLHRKGVLNLDPHRNRHAQFFKNLIEASRTISGLNAIEEFANSDSETPPKLPNLTRQSTKEIGEEINTASTQDLLALADKGDPLDYGETQSAEQILVNTSILESINVDEEAMQFYLNYSIDELWKCAFRDEKGILDN
jgi:hypothetical protein